MVGKLYIEENERRVTTPTAIGHRVAVTSVPSSGFTHLPMDVPEADNNAFWSAANPTRFTAKTAGLYICGYSVEWNPNAGNARGSVIVGKNGAPDRHAADFPANTLANFWQSGMTMYYLHANDYVEVLVYKSAAGASCRISTFWIVGITPEVII